MALYYSAQHCSLAVVGGNASASALRPPSINLPADNAAAMSRLAGFALPSPPIATRSFRFAFVRASGLRPSCDSGVTVQPSTLSRRAVLKIASICSAAIFASALDVPVADATAPKGAESVYDVEVVKDGKAKSLSFLKGKVTVFVNVASYCAVRVKTRTKAVTISPSPLNCTLSVAGDLLSGQNAFG
jgi:hypothetical protein